VRNAREEFSKHIAKVGVPIQCCKVEIFAYDYFDESINRSCIITGLRTGFTEEDFLRFLKLIDVDYAAGYGQQKLFGVIWYTDGTWSDRYEYDGGEVWEHHNRPEIPKELL